MATVWCQDLRLRWRLPDGEPDDDSDQGQGHDDEHRRGPAQHALGPGDGQQVDRLRLARRRMAGTGAGALGWPTRPAVPDRAGGLRRRRCGRRRCGGRRRLRVWRVGVRGLGLADRLRLGRGPTVPATAAARRRPRPPAVPASPAGGTPAGRCWSSAAACTPPPARRPRAGRPDGGATGGGTGSANTGVDGGGRGIGVASTAGAAAEAAEAAAGAGATGAEARDRLGKAVRELLDQLARHVGDHPATELSRPAGDVDVGDDPDEGRLPAVSRVQHGGDPGRCAARASAVLALGDEGHPPRRLRPAR